jgi:invasion protein IalB
MSTHSGAPVTASATGQHHELMQGIYRETAFINGAVQVPIPIGFVIPAGYTLQLSIDNGVAGDSLDYALMFEVENVVPGESVI